MINETKEENGLIKGRGPMSENDVNTLKAELEEHMPGPVTFHLNADPSAPGELLEAAEQAYFLLLMLQSYSLRRDGESR